ncbi:MAG TPA: glycosyltransferase family 4 protein [Vicinamibacterales bacterium]|jgi:glycosyltransferase involved in cell wall biosynthesis|nr:glycosyltransferase family 4 protein [Vicinamibacterales bacterium]
MSERPDVCWVFPDKMGGVASLAANLLQYRDRDEFTYSAVLTHGTLDNASRSSAPLRVDRSSVFEHSLPLENLHAVLRRLARAIGSAPGVLVCNDALELMLVSSLDVRRTVVQVVHGDYDYYYNLAADHEPYVHAFVAISRTVYDGLRQRLPHRLDSIFWLPYGVPLPARIRQPSAGPLRLLFVGRLDEPKGVLELPQMDALLRARDVSVTWTVVGDGPVRERLKREWGGGADSVRWVHRATPADVLAICAEHDVFVLPSRAEGLPVAMIEAMTAGVVPLVSDLPSLIEVVDNRTTGLRVQGGADAFVLAIETLARERAQLESMSAAACRLARDRFDIRRRAADYQGLWARWRDLFRPRPVAPTRVYGSRLDRPWFPNPLVRLVRTALATRRS